MNGILIDDTNDLVISIVKENGLIASGLSVGNIDYQRCRLIIEAHKCEFKEVPTLGFSIDSYLKAGIDKKQLFINELTKELKSDGFSDAKISVGETLLDFEVSI
jgi:hypothetical protein